MTLKEAKKNSFSFCKIEGEKEGDENGENEGGQQEARVDDALRLKLAALKKGIQVQIPVCHQLFENFRPGGGCTDAAALNLLPQILVLYNLNRCMSYVKSNYAGTNGKKGKAKK